MSVCIRTAEAADAADFAYVLCESWKAAYQDLLTPEQLTENTDLARRTAFFERLLRMRAASSRGTAASPAASARSAPSGAASCPAGAK